MDDPQLTVRDVDGDSPRRIVLGEVSPQARVNPCTQWNGSLVDLLDELGKQLTSMEIAQALERWRDDGVRETRFLIGAADGHGDAGRAKADLLIAFGAMTWPHMLARALLAEQLWRATSILAGHPYHRSG